MRIGFIGAGKVGMAMGIFWKNKGVSITGYFSRKMTSAKRAATDTSSKVYHDVNELIRYSDIIGITTPDDSIQEVATNLSSTTAKWDEKIIFHMSGVHSSEILSSLKNKGATICSVHPMYPFDDPHHAAANLNQAFFTLEGNGKRLHQIKELLEMSGLSWTTINGKEKILYHTAASLLSNYMVTLLHVGFHMLQDVGISEKKRLEISQPLVQRTLDNIFRSGTEKALTGPIARGDLETVKKHIQRLRDNPEWLKIYQVLGIQTVLLAEQAGKLNGKMAHQIKEVLTNG